MSELVETFTLAQLQQICSIAANCYTQGIKDAINGLQSLSNDMLANQAQNQGRISQQVFQALSSQVKPPAPVSAPEAPAAADTAPVLEGNESQDAPTVEPDAA